jgi:hypothetical protein
MSIKNSFLLIVLVTAFSIQTFSQKENGLEDSYQKEMRSLQAAIQKNLFDKASGNYLLVRDTAKREKKGDYLREYSYIWSLCALFQAANEIEKIDRNAKLLDPLIVVMNKYYDPAPPRQAIPIIS